MRVDEDGFTAFARSSSAGLLRAAYLMCGDWQLAEDLVQETLAKMYRPWLSARGIEAPWTYAQTTLLRTFLSARRRRSFGERPVADVPEHATLTEADPAIRLDLLRALSGLKRQDRAVLVLRYLHDLPVEDVAAALGKQPGAVRAQASRALDRLRALMGDAPEITAPAIEKERRR